MAEVAVTAAANAATEFVRAEAGLQLSSSLVQQV